MHLTGDDATRSAPGCSSVAGVLFATRRVYPERTLFTAFPAISAPRSGNPLV